MPNPKTTAEKQYRALTRLSLRRSPDPKSPLFEQWHVWEANEVFTPPAHMRVDKSLERGIVEEVKAGQTDG